MTTKFQTANFEVKIYTDIDLDFLSRYSRVKTLINWSFQRFKTFKKDDYSRAKSNRGV